LYVIHGDEPLLALEAADAIRGRAHAQAGFQSARSSRRSGLDWASSKRAVRAARIFGDKKLIELRPPSGKPGPDGAEAIEAFWRKAPADALTFVTLPRRTGRPERRPGSRRSTPWNRPSTSTGRARGFRVESPLPPRAKKQRATPETCSSSPTGMEANLLAAHQDDPELALLLPPGTRLRRRARVGDDTCAYDRSSSPKRALGGALAAARDASKACARRRGAAASAVDPRRGNPGLCACKAASRRAPLSDVLREARACGRCETVPRGPPPAKKLPRAALLAALGACAKVDRVVKGIVKGDAWDELLQLGLRFAG